RPCPAMLASCLTSGVIRWLRISNSNLRVLPLGGDMNTRNTRRKTPVTLLAASIGLALYMPSAIAQDAAEAQGTATDLDTIVVTGYRASLERAQDIKRGEIGMVDAVVAQDIGKFPDLNLAESLQRILGVVITLDGGEG